MSLILNDDWEKYQQGDYIAVNNVWGKTWMSNGQDYQQSISINDPADLSSGIQMRWIWRAPDSSNAVLAYPEISVGYKPWDPAGEGTTSLSARLLGIKTFTLTHQTEIHGDTNGFNVSYDLWLTSKPLGDQSTITTELMIWTHKGGPSDFGDSAIVGSYRQNGTTFDIVKYDNFTTGEGNSWRYIALVPRSDLPSATINVKNIFYDLIDRGLVSKLDFVTGYEFGAEVTGGYGNLTINRLTHVLDRNTVNSGANMVTGTESIDRLYGLGGNDTIKGNGGSDFLSGGSGNDNLYGGTGKDTFYFNERTGIDKIYDFAPGDTIALDNQTFTALTDGPLASNAFRQGTTFGVNTRILYDRTTGNLAYDADGSGSADTAHQIAVLVNHAKLNYLDFHVL